jgi:hypothetical protein
MLQRMIDDKDTQISALIKKLKEKDALCREAQSIIEKLLAAGKTASNMNNTFPSSSTR